MKKLIITAALVGSLPTKEQNPYVPILPDELAEDALACCKAGASVVHVHARTADGKNTHDAAIFKEIHDKIKEKAPELIVQISTGGRAGVEFEDRSKGLWFNPEMASLTTSSCNFATSIYANAPDVVEKLAAMMAEKNIKPELEIFDTSMILAAKDLKKKGLLKEPLYFNFIMGLKGAQEADVAQLAHLINMLPEGSEWNISGVGKNQIVTTMLGIALGGHVRVGLEDNIYYSKGVLASNAMLVERVARLAKEFGREIASPDEAREILGLKD